MDMSDYYGHTYKLTYKDKSYYGSSTNRPNQRYSQHKSSYKYRDQLKTHCTSEILFEEAEMNEGIVEHEVLDWCTTKEELIVRERYYRENYLCVNKQVPGRSNSEWHEINRDIVLDQRKAYRETNRSTLRLMDRERYAENKDAMIQRVKAFRAASPIVTCSCGGEYKKCYESAHLKTKIHQSYLDAQ
jgi:hypothetical protein